MLAFARLCVLAVSLALLINESLGANIQYTIYNSTNCQNAITSGVDNSPIYTSDNGQNTWQPSGCLHVSSLPGRVGSTTLSCLTGSNTVQRMYLYNDSSCVTPALYSASGAPGSGGCMPITTLSLAPTGLSYSLTCNGAYGMTALSLPLMAVLALLSAVAM